MRLDRHLHGIGQARREAASRIADERDLKRLAALNRFC
jgi:hypothetical protein